jgi:hypothetical protein
MPSADDDCVKSACHDLPPSPEFFVGNFNAFFREAGRASSGGCICAREILLPDLQRALRLKKDGS